MDPTDAITEVPKMSDHPADLMAAHSLRFSVIMPTYNRCTLLGEALLSVRNQDLSPSVYEIIVVDNASSDDTRTLVENLSGTEGPSIRYVFESRPGLHWARHAGAHAAQGEILAFTDDDALADRGWLTALAHAYDELDADCVGGRIIIQWDQTPPEWVLPYEPILGQLDYGLPMRMLEPGQFINGGNFSIKRHRLFQIGGFNPDQIGDHLVGDGETGLCIKIHDAGWRMAWAPAALVWHRQIAGRHGTLPDMKRRFANNGVGHAYQYYRQTRCRRRHLLRKASLAALRSIRQCFQATQNSLRRNALYYECELRAAWWRGQMGYFLRLAADSHFRVLALRNDWIHMIDKAYAED
jgi:glycosyltransferase involved in cell wall biosynthesis